METQVSFASEGEQVFGVLHLPDAACPAGIIMCHGFTGHKAEAHRLFVDAARDFARHAIAVLRFDFRGSGDSAGEFRDMTVSREIEDARAALGYIASRTEVDSTRLGVLGLSLGGCVGACLAGTDERVRALVLWAAVAHPERIRDRFETAVGNSGVLDMEGWELGRPFLNELPEIQPLRDVAHYEGPSLVVHGTADESVPASDASDYRIALGERCRVHMVNGADHVFSSLSYKSEVVATSREFLMESLSAGP